jgi:hypothetical protein
MSVVAVVKKAVEAELDEFWASYLPEGQKNAYYRGCRELDRENKDESRDALIMRAAVDTRKK